MSKDEKSDSFEPVITHSGLTQFPALRQLLTLVLLALLETQGIYICLPLNQDFNISFLIGQILLLTIIVYSWFMILMITPGPISQLFREEFIKKTIQEAFKKSNQQIEQKVCTKCQIETVAKIYHCKQCNRCVYKHFFHSKWLNTCVAKENFAPFVTFLVFFEIYLILLVINNAIFFFHLRNQSEDSIAIFLIRNFQNAIVSLFLVLVFVLMLMVMSMLTFSYVLAFKSKTRIKPFNCKIGCNGIGNISPNDKILYMIHQSIRESNYYDFNNQSASESSNEDIFRNMQSHSAAQMSMKSLKKPFVVLSSSKQKQVSQVCSIQNYQGTLFKTDFFQSAKIFKKKQNSAERAKKKFNQLNSFAQNISNMTSLSWKRHIKSTYQKDSYVKRNSQLDSVLERKTEENQTPVKLLQMIKSEQKDILYKRESIMKSKSLVKTKITPQDSHESQLKLNPNNLNLKKIRFVKKGLRDPKLTKKDENKLKLSQSR